MLIKNHHNRRRGAGGREGVREVLWEREKEKSYVVVQHFISVGGFTTQLEAYRLAERIREVCNLPDEMISINATYLELSQSDYDKYLDKVKAAKRQSLQ